MLLDPSQFEDRMSRFRWSAFRLETLDAYDVGEDEELRRYLRGEPRQNPEQHRDWTAMLRDERAAGKTRQRVHIVQSPLSGYLRYECEWGYLPNSGAGEDIRILELAERQRPAGLDIGHDFWLLDDADVLRMRYDPAGRFMGAETVHAADLPRYRAARDAALAAGEAFLPYWQRHPEYHQANQTP
jgi:hypothetical protein